MPEELADLEGRMVRLSNEELVEMITAAPDKFNQAETLSAEEELSARGFRVERQGTDLKIIPPDGVDSTPLQTAEEGVRLGPIIRDVVIVWVLTAVGGFVIGVVAASLRLDRQLALPALLVSNFLLGTVAFAIAGYLAPPGRWRHLALVALVTWLTSFINVLFLGTTIPQWLGGAIFVAIIMGLGGAASYMLKRDAKPPAWPLPPPPPRF